jgi:hypothetical protein
VKPEGEINFFDLPGSQRKDWHGAQRSSRTKGLAQCSGCISFGLHTTNFIAVCAVFPWAVGLFGLENLVF